MWRLTVSTGMSESGYFVATGTSDECRKGGCLNRLGLDFSMMRDWEHQRRWNRWWSDCPLNLVTHWFIHNVSTPRHSAQCIMLCILLPLSQGLLHLLLLRFCFLSGLLHHCNYSPGVLTSGKSTSEHNFLLNSTYSVESKMPFQGRNSCYEGGFRTAEQISGFSTLLTKSVIEQKKAWTDPLLAILIAPFFRCGRPCFSQRALHIDRGHHLDLVWPCKRWIGAMAVMGGGRGRG